MGPWDYDARPMHIGSSRALIGRRSEDCRPPGKEAQAASFSAAGKSTGIFVTLRRKLLIVLSPTTMIASTRSKQGAGMEARLTGKISGRPSLAIPKAHTVKATFARALRTT